MNEKPVTDETQKRLSWLKAMQARHKQGLSDVAEPASDVPERMVVSGDTGFLDSFELGAQQGAPGAQRAAMVQKLRKFLARPEGGIDQQKARMVVQFVRRQASDPDAPHHEKAKKILAAVRNLDPDLRRRLLGAAGQGAPAPGLGARDLASGASGRDEVVPANQSRDASSPPRTGETWFDDLIDKL